MTIRPPSTILEATGLVKHYEGRKVLDGISLTIAANETIVVTGPNGSGKSTLLRVLAAVSRPDSGSLTIGKTNATKEPDRARTSLSILTQEPALYDELTALEHVQWWSRLTGRAADSLSAIREAGLALQMHRRAATLSRGQRQRLALAMACLGDPPLLLLDEPFTGLDSGGHAWLESVLQARRGRQATILALHGDDASRLADRVMLLRHHKLEVTV